MNFRKLADCRDIAIISNHLLSTSQTLTILCDITVIQKSLNILLRIVKLFSFFLNLRTTDPVELAAALRGGGAAADSFSLARLLHHPNEMDSLCDRLIPTPTRLDSFPSPETFAAARGGGGERKNLSFCRNEPLCKERVASIKTTRLLLFPPTLLLPAAREPDLVLLIEDPEFGLQKLC